MTNFIKKKINKTKNVTIRNNSHHVLRASVLPLQYRYMKQTYYFFVRHAQSNRS